MKTKKKKIPERSRSVLGRFYCNYKGPRLSRRRRLSILLSMPLYCSLFLKGWIRYYQQLCDGVLSLPLSNGTTARGVPRPPSKSFLHPSRFRSTTVQFLHSSSAASSFTPSTVYSNANIFHVAHKVMTMGTGSFTGEERPGRGVDHPPPYSAEVK